jgi:hypothetical protein
VAALAHRIEVIVPPVASLTPATEIRGTLLASSLAMVRERGKESAYFTALEPAHHEAVRSVLAQAWLPMELAVAHYAAMGLVFPAAHEQIDNGKIVSERTQNGYLRTIVRALHATGTLDIPTAVRRLPAVMERMVRGGGIAAAYRTGLKDVRIELSGYPFLKAVYTHNAWQGMLYSALSLVTARLTVRQDLRFRGDQQMALDVSWV